MFPAVLDRETHSSPDPDNADRKAPFAERGVRGYEVCALLRERPLPDLHGGRLKRESIDGEDL